jgi:hypothetical protein
MDKDKRIAELEDGLRLAAEALRAARARIAELEEALALSVREINAIVQRASNLDWTGGPCTAERMLKAAREELGRTATKEG